MKKQATGAAENGEVIRYLRVLIGLILRQPISMRGRVPRLRELVQTLFELGVGQSDICRILNKPNNYVSKELTSIRKQSRERKRGQKIGGTRQR